MTVLRGGLSLALFWGLLSASTASAAPYPGFERLFSQIWPEARKAGVSQATLLKVLDFIGEPDWSLSGVRKPRKTPLRPGQKKRPPHVKRPPAPPFSLPGRCYRRPQREFLRPADYFPEKGPHGMALMVKKGQEKKKEYADTLAHVEQMFGIRSSVLLAIWARETLYGAYLGKHNVLRTLATRAAYARSKWQRRFNRRHLVAALKIVEQGHVTMQDFVGSWLGATGHTQFMPLEFFRYGVSADNNPAHIDIWKSPKDAFASTANFLLKKGSHYKHGKVWQPGVTWGYEVQLPPGFDCTLEGRKTRKPIWEWAKFYGIKRASSTIADGRGFAANRHNKRAYLLLPEGTQGPAFAMLNNFDVFRHYNKSDMYALYLGYLADRINCDTEDKPCLFVGKWASMGKDAFPFSVKKLCGLQILLKETGHYNHRIDGLFGPGMRVAIGEYQKARGLPLTCYPGKSLVAAMCQDRPDVCRALRKQGALAR